MVYVRRLCITVLDVQVSLCEYLSASTLIVPVPKIGC